MGRKPPSEMERLYLFLDLAEHYISACEELPLASTVSMSLDAKLPLALEMRLMLQRKFVELEHGEDGNVHLRRVASAFRECFTGSSPVLQQNLDSYAAEVGTVLEGKTGIVVNGEQDEKKVVFYDALYGRLMHADWGRAEMNKGRAGFIAIMALTDICHHLDQLIREAHLSVKSALDAGQLK